MIDTLYPETDTRIAVRDTRIPEGHRLLIEAREKPGRGGYRYLFVHNERPGDHGADIAYAIHPPKSRRTLAATDEERERAVERLLRTLARDRNDCSSDWANDATVHEHPAA